MVRYYHPAVARRVWIVNSQRRKAEAADRESGLGYPESPIVQIAPPPLLDSNESIKFTSRQAASQFFVSWVNLAMNYPTAVAS
jgi:hypothetical protein